MSALIALAYLSLVILSLLDNVRGPFFPDILSDLHLNDSLGSLFWATTSLCAFVGSWMSHRIVRRRSSLFLLASASLLTAVGYACLAQAPNLVSLLPFCAVFGLGYGGLNLAQNLMIHEAASPARRRRLFAGLHSMYAMAAFLAPGVASLFRWWGSTWRGCFTVLALLPLPLVAASWRVRGRRLGEPETVAAPLTVREWRSCLLFSLMMAGYLWGEISISTRLPEWLRDGLAYSPDRADFFLGVFCGALFAGRALFSVLHFSRFDNWRILRASAALSACAYALALCVSPWWFAACGLCMAPFFPLAMEQVSVSFGPKSAEALGFVLGAGSLSIVLLHLTVGVLSDALGIGRALYVGPAALAAVVLILETA